MKARHVSASRVPNIKLLEVGQELVSSGNPRRRGRFKDDRSAGPATGNLDLDVAGKCEMPNQLGVFGFDWI